MLRMVMASPWAVRIEDEAPLTVIAVLRGDLVTTLDDGTTEVLGAGEIGIVRGPGPYVIGDRPGSAVQVIVHPGQVCEDLHGRPLEEPFNRGVRTWGNDPDGETVVLVGTYEQVGEAGRHLLSTLPRLLRIDGDEMAAPIVDLLATEIVREAPGQEVVLDRLLDLLTVSTLRAWFDREDSTAPGWWRAAGDPIVGPALQLLHHNPAHAWTVASLAAQVGASRASLARRFNDLVGVPPMEFLTDWRLALAADLLLEPGATVQGVASRVGYGSGFALSAAFKRVRGCSPTEHRAATLAA